MKKYYGNVFIDFNAIECVNDENARCRHERGVNFNGFTTHKLHRDFIATSITVCFSSHSVILRGVVADEFLKDHKEYVSEQFPVDGGMQ